MASRWKAFRARDHSNCIVAISSHLSPNSKVVSHLHTRKPRTRKLNAASSRQTQAWSHASLISCGRTDGTEALHDAGWEARGFLWGEVCGRMRGSTSGCRAGSANPDKAWGRDWGPHLKLHVCLGELFCFLFQWHHPDLPLLSATGGGSPVPFQKFPPPLIRVLIHHPSPASPCRLGWLYGLGWLHLLCGWWNLRGRRGRKWWGPRTCWVRQTPSQCYKSKA